MQSARNSSVEHVRNAVIRHISRARKALRQPTLDDGAVHDARKDLKRARSGLRLLRPLDEAAFRRENMRLRNAGRRLSAVRDDKVLLERVTTLLAKEKQPARRQLLLALRKDLRNDRRRDWRKLHSNERMHGIGDSLAEAVKRVRQWPMPAGADAAPALAVKQIYRQGRKALKRSQKKPGDEHLHEARKKAKHLGQALQILAGTAPPKKAKKVLARADDVGDWLGDDHDLAVVEARLLARPAGGEKTKKTLRTRLEAKRARLQKKALAAAGKLFRKKTRRVLRRAARPDLTTRPSPGSPSRSARSTGAASARPRAAPAAGRA